MKTTEVLSTAEARETLTPRDIEVIEFVASGFERDDIASRLGISRTAVNRHMRKAFELTGAVNAAHLVAILMADGRLPLGHARIRARAESIVAGYLIDDPQSMADERVNRRLLSVARALGEQL